jgi:GNAT superfamily N-acetyltransferase
VLLIETADPSSAPAQQILAVYFRDIVVRYHGRAISDAELAQAVAAEPAGELEGASGALLLGTEAGVPVACAGVRYLGEIAELTKVFTLPHHRGSGIASRLIARIEQLCSERGVRTVRLDTRSDLGEACALYERLGYERVDAFNDSPYSDRWYAKTLGRD